MSYRLLTSLLFPVFLLYTLKLAIKFKSLIYLKQRMGFSYPTFNSQPIWIHCASVGEINTFMPLLEHLINKLPQQTFVITTNTVTGASMLKKHSPINTQHCYLPVENSAAINRFLNHTQPKLALIMETEIWPLLYKLINKKQIPLSIINARLSAKTIDTHNWIKKQYRHALQYVDFIFARSEQDLNSFKQLGGDVNKLLTAGNLKFSSISDSQPAIIENFTQRKYVLAASTHDDEELQLAQLWKNNTTQDTLLVIAPRHPDRSDDILKQLTSLDLKIAVRSKGDSITQDTDIYLADTLGELSGFMQHAQIVFMGGSLIPHGGQNFLEAARLAKAIIVGPHMHNFQNEIDLFKQHHACIQIQNISELDSAIQSLLIDSNTRSNLESCAKQLMDEQTGIAETYLKNLQQHYPQFF